MGGAVPGYLVKPPSSQTSVTPPKNSPNPNHVNYFQAIPASLRSRFSPLACYRHSERIQTMQTGPRTAEGKAASSMNAMSHGLTSRMAVLPGEDPAQFQHLRRSLLKEHQPATPTEKLLVEEMAQAHWRLDRVRRRQDQAFDSETLDTKLLALLQRYATANERTFFKSLETLKKLQRERLLPAEQTFVSKKAEQEAFFNMMDALTAPPGAA